ncbi:hypothetical protein B0H94_10877 [Salsuginibacillus halophilus]|uniref:Molecular chaperone DnaJ n=1 Tax=Salsuginibacillus halophilus TaxID=517424 RepID=A0A2P8HE18_9BACI|nr:YuiA family protein [Salsuginibacillus halophilus]PSL44466.1 hypothetical protein B0H94_10877 [Salsuginibacillus halophilus]
MRQRKVKSFNQSACSYCGGHGYLQLPLEGAETCPSCSGGGFAERSKAKKA